MKPTDTRLKNELADRLQFEMLMTDISARFVNLPSVEVDGVIEDSQRRICECLGLDLSALWQWTDELPRRLNLTHLHSPPKGPELPEEGLYAEDAFPWSLRQMLKGEPVIIYTKDLPPEAARDQEMRRHFGVMSSVGIPLSAGRGPINGFLSFDSLREEWIWPPETVKRLILIAQVFSNALERKRFEQALLESESRLSMAADSADAGLWELDCATGTFWATDRARSIFGYGSEEIIGMERFEALVHPDDLERVQRAITRALEENEPIDVEYRLRTDEKQKWISSRGRTHRNSAGDPDRILGISCDITQRKQMEEQLRRRMEEIECLRQELERENIYLREEIEVQGLHEKIVGRSPEMRRVLAQLEQVAPTDSTVLLTGETGTGKELLAQALHRLSNRRHRPLVTVNCASLPPTLVESELFGREPGAYTGAMTRMTGRFEAADKATLFLDEIGELPHDVQAKLLRVLEQGCFERLGSARTKQVDVRIIAATNHDLERRVSDGKFRKDLFFRLNVFPIHLPPLRERAEDIPALVWTFIQEFEGKMGKRIDSISRQCMNDLQHHAWPGNIRELKNEIERAMILCNGRALDVCLHPCSDLEDRQDFRLEEAERKHITRVLQKTGWRLSGRGGAAEILGLKRTTLQSKMKKLGIRRPPG